MDDKEVQALRREALRRFAQGMDLPLHILKTGHVSEVDLYGLAQSA